MNVNKQEQCYYSGCTSKNYYIAGIAVQSGYVHICQLYSVVSRYRHVSKTDKNPKSRIPKETKPIGELYPHRRPGYR